MRRSFILGGLSGLLGIRRAKAEEDCGFDYANVEYPTIYNAGGACPDGYAYDDSEDRCVSMLGWCEGVLWTCAGRPERNDHPQFVCNPTRERQQRCCRVGWPPERCDRDRARCYKWNPRPVE